MLKEQNDSNTLIYTVNIDNYGLDVEDEIKENIVYNINENIKEYSILKNVKVDIEDNIISIYSGKSKIYNIEKQKNDKITSIFVYEVKPATEKEDKDYYKTLFSVVWKAIDNTKEEIEADLKHRVKKDKKDIIPDDSFKSDIKIIKIYEYLMGEVGKKNTNNFNKLAITMDDLFTENYRGIDDLVKIVYTVYKDLSKEDNKVLNNAFVYIFEDYKRRNTVLDNVFYSGNLENKIKKTNSYIESEKYLKDVIYRIYEDFKNDVYKDFEDIKGKKELIVFITDIVHVYHKMFCNMYEIPIKSECRDTSTVMNYIIKNHTNVTLDDYTKIKKWADTILVDDGTKDFQQELFSNISTLYLKNNKKDYWNIDKTELALVARYDEIMVKNKYDEKIFPIYSLLEYAKGCNDVEEYIANTKNELDKINDLDYTDTMKDIIKSVTVIYHYIFLYQYGLDVEINTKKLDITNSFITDIELDNEIIEEEIEDKVEVDIENPIDLDFDLEEDIDIDFNKKLNIDLDLDLEEELTNNEEVEEETEVDLDTEITLDKDIDLDLDLDLDIDTKEEIEEKVETEETVEIEEQEEEEQEEIIEEVVEEKKVTINTENNLEYELLEEKEKYIMNVILPGLKKSEVEVDYEYNKIIITTAASTESKCKITEKYYNNILEQAIENVDEDGIDASLKSGILTIIIPKKTITKKKITIK